MGLAGAKNKRKIGDDPNNTKWARKTDSFGHKILRAHGWEPGQYLGTTNKEYTALHTAASASHIKAVLREDNLGIGAKGANGGSADQCTGLDVFKDLLGRLNGKTEAVIEKQQKARDNVKMSLYVERRYGPMRFVRGGLLVGDSMNEESDESKDAPTESSNDTTATNAVSTSDDEKAARKKVKKERKLREKAEEKERKEKKRKAESDAEDSDDDDTKRKEKKRRRKDRSEAEAKEESDDVETEESAKKTEKKAKKDKKDKKDRKEKKDKKDKKERKEKKAKKRKDAAGESTSETTEDEPVPTEQPKPAPSLALGRHLSRRRYIAQKRAAVMDPQALKQIFMIKA